MANGELCMLKMSAGTIFVKDPVYLSVEILKTHEKKIRLFLRLPCSLLLPVKHNTIPLKKYVPIIPKSTKRSVAQSKINRANIATK